MRIKTILLAAVGLMQTLAVCTGESPPIAKLHIKNEQILLPDKTPALLQGFNWGWWNRHTEGDAALITEHMPKANFIRYVFRWYRDTSEAARIPDAPGHIDPAYLTILDRDLKWLANHKLWVLLEVEAGGGSSRKENFWNSPSLRREFIEMWEFLAKRYKDMDYVAAYGILAEPHPEKNVSHKQVREFYKEVIDHISRIDKHALFVVGPSPFYASENLTDDYHIQGYPDRIIYCFNMLVAGDKMKLKSYPGVPGSKYYRTKKGIARVNRDWLESKLSQPLAFRRKWKVPVFCDQYGMTADVENYIDGLGDMVSLMQQNDIHSTYWTWKANERYGILTTKEETNEKLWSFFTELFAD
jgi:hypothetical protein